MTRVITNKVVVPKNYLTSILGLSYPALSRTNTTTHNIEVSDISPFDFVYDNGYDYASISENVNIEGGGLLINPIDITYKITFNIKISLKNYNFFRFRLHPNIDVRISGNTDHLGKLNYITPRLNVTINVCRVANLTEAFSVINSKSITINFDQKEDFYYTSKENGYSIIYNALTNEIYDDTENGTEPWAIPTAEDGEDEGVMLTSLDGDVTTAADVQFPSTDIPSIDVPIPSTHNNGARIDKAVVPQDYARLIYSTEMVRTDSLNTEHDLTTLDLSDLPRYDMVGEISCIYTDDGYFEIFTNLTGQAKSINSRYILSSGIENMYRLIRIIEKPNLSLINSGNRTIPGVYYKVYLNINETTYVNTIVLALQLGVGEKITTGDAKFAFIFDTKTKEFYNDTENGVGIWSSRYESQSVLPSTPSTPIL